MTMTTIPTNVTLFLIHRDGANHLLKGRRLIKLLRALEKGEGGPEILRLVEYGYSETMGGQCLDSVTFESLLAEARGQFAGAPSNERRT
jgi:hypothetical protein